MIGAPRPVDPAVDPDRDPIVAPGVSSSVDPDPIPRRTTPHGTSAMDRPARWTPPNDRRKAAASSWTVPGTSRTAREMPHVHRRSWWVTTTRRGSTRHTARGFTWVLDDFAIEVLHPVERRDLPEMLTEPPPHRLDHRSRPTAARATGSRRCRSRPRTDGRRSLHEPRLCSRPQTPTRTRCAHRGPAMIGPRSP